MSRTGKTGATRVADFASRRRPTTTKKGVGLAWEVASDRQYHSTTAVRRDCDAAARLSFTRLFRRESPPALPALAWHQPEALGRRVVSCAVLRLERVTLSPDTECTCSAQTGSPSPYLYLCFYTPCTRRRPCFCRCCSWQLAADACRPGASPPSLLSLLQTACPASPHAWAARRRGAALAVAATGWAQSRGRACATALPTMPRRDRYDDGNKLWCWLCLFNSINCICMFFDCLLLRKSSFRS